MFQNTDGVNLFGEANFKRINILDDNAILAPNTINGGGSSSELSEKLRKLYESVGETLNAHIREFIENSNDVYDFEFDREEFVRISDAIVQNKSYNREFVNYENIRGVIANTLELLHTGIIVHTEKSDLEVQNEALAAKANILDDTTLLQEYINELQNRLQLFPEQTVQMTVAPMIKPEYLEYINRYGLPENAIFEPEKLGLIRLELGISS